jgi:hypothetical protein
MVRIRIYIKLIKDKTKHQNRIYEWWMRLGVDDW